MEAVQDAFVLFWYKMATDGHWPLVASLPPTSLAVNASDGPVFPQAKKGTMLESINNDTALKLLSKILFKSCTRSSSSKHCLFRISISSLLSTKKNLSGPNDEIIIILMPHIVWGCLLIRDNSLYFFVIFFIA